MPTTAVYRKPETVLVGSLTKSDLTVFGLSDQQRVGLRQAQQGLMLAEDGGVDKVVRLPIVPERLISLPKKLSLFKPVGRIEPLDLLWELEAIEESCMQVRRQRPYVLQGIRWTRLTVMPGGGLGDVVRVWKDNLSQSGAQPLTTNEIVDLALACPEILQEGRLLSTAGYSAGPLPQLALSATELMLGIAKTSGREESWLAPYARHMV